jgi:hypothetical protein
VDLLALDPEDVGFNDLEVPTVLRAVSAATMLNPDVDYWGAYWINTRDPARVQWSSLPVSLSGANGESDFPVTLAPGESFLLTSTVSTSAVLAANPGIYEGELVIGWTFDASIAPAQQPVALQAGDADQDLDFDQLDLVKVQQAGKYLTGQSATWGEGDWNGAPGGSAGSPPAGDGLFNQRDIVAALSAGLYRTGPYAALGANGQLGDSQTSIRYDARSGELSVDAPVGIQLTSINIDSAAGIFTGNAASNLGGSFDNDSDTNVFKATFGSNFGSLSFGTVAQAGLSEAVVLGDLTVVGSLAGGGGLGVVDLIYVPEPATLILVSLGLLGLIVYQVRFALMTVRGVDGYSGSTPPDSAGMRRPLG